MAGGLSLVLTVRSVQRSPGEYFAPAVLGAAAAIATCLVLAASVRAAAAGQAARARALGAFAIVGVAIWVLCLFVLRLPSDGRWRSQLGVAEFSWLSVSAAATVAALFRKARHLSE